jgi:hypothetical protein
MPSERVARCSLSPRERVRVRGNEIKKANEISASVTHPPVLRIPILFKPLSFALLIRVIP